MFCFMYPQISKRWWSKIVFRLLCSRNCTPTFKTVAPPLQLTPYYPSLSNFMLAPHVGHLYRTTVYPVGISLIRNVSNTRYGRRDEHCVIEADA